MQIQTRLRTICPVALALVAVASVQAGEQCEPHWDNTIGQPGMNGPVHTLTVFDDGSGGGPALYAGGVFTTAGGVAVNRIAKWDGTSWSPLGTGVNDSIWAMTVFDDGMGGGSALYAGGGFTTAGGMTVNRIAKWDGSSWSPLGTGLNDTVRALTVFDDGSGGGPELYAGGNFTTAGGVPASRIAKWDGTGWSPLGSGIEGDFTYVWSLAVFDDGSGVGPALYAGGLFTTAGGVSANRIAKWDGLSWSPVGSGMNQVVYALTVFDDGSGSGSALYAGGGFSSAGDVTVNSIAKWNGSSWSPLGSGMNEVVRVLTVFDDDSTSGPALYAGGHFTTAGGASANRIAKWNGSAWSPLGTGIAGGNFPWVWALTVFNDGSSSGSSLYAGGWFFASEGATANRIAKWGCPKCEPADLDCDGTVGVADLLILLASWGECPDCTPGECPADLTGSCTVGVADLLDLIENWG